MTLSDTAMYDGVIAGESLQGAMRWQMPDLGYTARPPTAEQLEAIEVAAHADGYASGRSEGLAEGRRLGEQAVRDEARRLHEILGQLARPLADLDVEVERTLIALTIEVARRLVEEQLQLDPMLTAHAIRAAVASIAPPPREIRVHLHPDDAQLLSDLPPPADVQVWRLVPDYQLRRGDVRLVTETAQVDALLDTRQSGIARALLGEVE